MLTASFSINFRNRCVAVALNNVTICQLTKMKQNRSIGESVML